MVDLAGEYMDAPRADIGLAEAIVHVMKNECVRLLVEEIHREQE